MNPAETASVKLRQKVRHHEPEWKREKVVRIPVRWVWHYGMLHSLRERLLQEQENEMAAAAEPVEPHSMSLADSATDEFDHEMALCLLSRERDALREVDAAIHRILTGTYGICEESGEPIPAGRLHVVPWTRYTKEAQKKREREGLDSLRGIPPLESIQEPDAALLAEAEDPEGEELLTRETNRHRREADIRNIEQGADDEIDRQPDIETPMLTETARPPNKKQTERSSNRRHHTVQS
ncbi:MAG: TraR/DksA family transcriptional regulator [Verrucomicrobia bacterium]|nr:TraR/DksA family transcriptional regulator [Verrucomicrobiota bacterium]